MIPFRIYYDDESTFDGLPEDAPSHAFVVAIAWNDPIRDRHCIGRPAIHEWDIYIFSDPVGSWHGTNKYADLMNHLKRRCGIGGVRAVLDGLWIDTQKYRDILHRAETDPDFEKKSAIDPVREDGRE